MAGPEAPARLCVGVLGGIGPAATADLFARLIAGTPAARDGDHLRVLIDNNPTVPDCKAAIRGEGPSPGPELAAMAQGLERSGADFVVLACNAAHAFERDIRDALSVPFVSLIEETCETALRTVAGFRTVGVMAGDACVEAGLYTEAFARRGVGVVGPARQAELMSLVQAIKAGDTRPAVRRSLVAIADDLVAQGAEALISGCTELSLVVRPADVARPLIDPTDVLVERTLAYASLREPLPTCAPKPEPDAMISFNSP